MGLVPPETLQRPVPGRTAADLRQEGWILRMRQKDRRSVCDAVHTKCSDLVNSAEHQREVSGKNEDCMGDGTAHVSDMTTSWMTGLFR